MKEQIYTIPVNEAYEQDCECPVCYLHKTLEDEALEYTLGAAMMEPDYRILSNELGYCNKHFSLLFSKPNKLSLALILDTHLDQMRKKFSSLSKDVDRLKSKKRGLFKKSSNDSINKITDLLTKNITSCVVCEKIENTLKRYNEVFFYMWKNDENFRKKVENSKGFCLAHFKLMCENAYKYLNTKEAAEFINLIYKKEISELERLQKDIHRFTLKFDYRNKDMELGTAIDAPLNTMEKLSGHLAYKDNSSK